MKKVIGFVLVAVMILSMAACSNNEKELEPQAAQMKTICELGTMQCYYHNVAKYMDDDAAGMLLWKKDRKFWVEYSGVVTIGVDASLVDMEVDGENVTITIPPAKVLGCKVDEKTLTKDSFIVAKGSAAVEAEHQTEAFKDAQAKMQEEASNDTVLLANAQQRAQKLLENYVNNIGDCVGKTYNIKWVYLDDTDELNDADADVPVNTAEQS